MVDGQVVQDTLNGRLVTEDAISDQLIDRDAVGRRGDLAEGGVHAEDRQQGDGK